MVGTAENVLPQLALGKRNFSRNVFALEFLNAVIRIGVNSGERKPTATQCSSGAAN